MVSIANTCFCYKTYNAKETIGNVLTLTNGHQFCFHVNFDNQYALLWTPNACCDMLMRIFTHCLFFRCVFIDFQCVITLLGALSVALNNYLMLILHLICSTEVIRLVAEAGAVEMRAKHNDYIKHNIYTDHTGLSCFAPVINIFRHPLWGRNQVLIQI